MLRGAGECGVGEGLSTKCIVKGLGCGPEERKGLGWGYEKGLLGRDEMGARGKRSCRSGQRDGIGEESGFESQRTIE